MLWWALTGFNAGFTKTSVPVAVVDQVTGIESVDWQPAFVPGLDFLGASVAAGLGLGGACWLAGRRRHHRPQQPPSPGTASLSPPPASNPSESHKNR